MGGIPRFSEGKYFVRMLSHTKEKIGRMFGRCHKKRKAVSDDSSTSQTSSEAPSPVQSNKCQQEPSCEEMRDNVPMCTEPVVVLADDSPPPENELKEDCQVVALSCGELENACMPVELQDKIYELRQRLILKFPPYYDFCIISSDEDIEEATEFKNYICKTFNLMGCTVYEGWARAGEDVFDSYERMIAQSSKVFFYVTKNFSQDTFCKRIQSGAVFQSLMSKYSKNHEKCVPVYPNELDNGPFHLSLSGVNGLMPYRPHLMQQSIRNTYTYELKAIRHMKNKVHYEKRCIEFKKEVTLYLDQYNSSNMLRLQNETHPPLPCTSSNEITDVSSVEIAENSCGTTSEVKDCRLNQEIGHKNEVAPPQENDSDGNGNGSGNNTDIEEKEKFPTEEISADMPEEFQNTINCNPSQANNIVIKDVENAQIGDSYVIYQTIIQPVKKRCKKSKKK